MAAQETTSSSAGGAGADILIGGLGVDTILAGLGSDIVVGGGTSYDANATQLNAIRDKWTIGLATSFDAAVTSVTTGTNALTATTVTNDFAIDDLTGNDPSEVAPGLADLFFSADQDILRDFQPNDRRRRVV